MQSCPWAKFDPATISFCEERLCAYIVEPSNTWSNLAFIGAGIWIIYLCRNHLTSFLTTIGFTAILVGIGSFSFHATGTWWGEFLDVSAMFLISGQFITFTIRRQFRWSDRSLLIFYIILSTASMTLLWNIRKIGIPLFALQVTFAATIELWMFFKRRVDTNYKYLGFMAVAFLISFSAWVLDISGVLCDPKNHFITGHAVWHLANSFCLYYFFRFNLQFDAKVKDSLSQS